MGRAKKAFGVFVDSIPDEKLSPLGEQAGTIYSNQDFRVDMQGMTSNPSRFNLQVQVNNQTKISTLKNLRRSYTVSAVLVPNPQTMTAADIKRALKENCPL